MKKDQNSSKESTKPVLTLPRGKILRGKRNFQRLFQQSSVLRAPDVHLRYRIYDDPSEGCFIGFIAAKKLGTAVKRNRLKRLLREVYRTHQHLVSDLFASNTFGFHGVFLAQKDDVTFQSLEKETVPILKKMRAVLLEHSGSEESNKRLP